MPCSQPKASHGPTSLWLETTTTTACPASKPGAWPKKEPPRRAHTQYTHSLALSPCKCKAKTAIVTNTAPEPAHLITLEQSNFGVAALVPDTIQLGLVVRGRIRGLTDLDKEVCPGPPDLFGRDTFPDHGGILQWVTANTPKPLAEIFKKATTSAAALLNTLRLTTVSIRQRAIFYGTYCLSKFTYVASYARVTQKEINLMQIKVAKAVLRRHWIQARHLPGTLRA